jgi:hypothetical protein
MTVTNQQLWQRIQAFAINDPNAAFSFTQRLTRENNWTAEFAERVVEEYKKFIYLTCTGEAPATPSDAVDQAWHLHLAYTKSYWQELCGHILGRPLHHNPTKGGESEAVKFDHQYQLTLQRYQEEFEQEAPADIWPAPEKRFADDDFKRVNLKTHIAWSKKKLRNIVAVLTALLGAAAWQISSQVAFLILGCIVAVVITALNYGGGGSPGSGCSGGGCGTGCGRDGCGGGSGCGGCGGGCS